MIIEYQVTIPNIRWSPELWFICNTVLQHSLIRAVLIQSCPAGAKNFTNYVMYNSVVLSKILKIVVPLEQNFEKN